MANQPMDSDAIVRVVAPMGKEELAIISFYLKLLEKVDDEDALQLFKRMILESANHLRLDTEMLLKLAPSARKKPSSQSELFGLLQALDTAESCERAAYKMYDDALPKLSDPYMRQTAQLIRDEEAKHVRMVQELRAIIKRKMAKK